MRGVAVVALCAGGGVQRLAEVVGVGIAGGQGFVGALHEGVFEPARGTARDHRADAGALGARTGQGGAIGRIGGGLRARDEGCAQLRAGRAQRQRRCDPGAVHDPACRDDWDVQFARQQPRQRQGGEAGVVSRVEDAAMTAGLDPLGHHHVDPRRLGLSAFLGRGGAGDQDAADGF
ncbi:hypothetical protein D3C72_1343070 [compost metagenome]